MTFTISPIPVFKDNYVWTLVNDKNKEALVVDPGDAVPVQHFLEKRELNLIGILLTHHHWDHTNGMKDLKKHYQCPVVGSDNIVGITENAEDKKKINFSTFPISFQVLSIPGHTIGHVAYYGGGMLFSGDTLFAAGCGRLFEGTPNEMYHSLQKLASLPQETKLYCGHEYTLKNLAFACEVEPGNKQIKERIKKVEALIHANQPSLPSTLAEELETNPFLRCESDELRKHVAKFAGLPLNDSVETFAWLRKWKDQFG